MIELPDDAARIDLDRVHGWLASSYWSPGIDREVAARAIAGPHSLGAFHALLRPDRYMERLSSAAAALLKAAS